MRIEDVKAGDIIRIHGYSGDINEYVFTDGEGLYLNACNESWIARGLRGYGEEGYPLTQSDVENAEVVGHYGDGWFSQGWSWYAKSGRYERQYRKACKKIAELYDDYEQYITSEIFTDILFAERHRYEELPHALCSSKEEWNRKLYRCAVEAWNTVHPDRKVEL